MDIRRPCPLVVAGRAESEPEPEDFEGIDDDDDDDEEDDERRRDFFLAAVVLAFLK